MAFGKRLLSRSFGNAYIVSIDPLKFTQMSRDMQELLFVSAHSWESWRIRRSTHRRELRRISWSRRVVPRRCGEEEGRVKKEGAMKFDHTLEACVWRRTDQLQPSL